MENADLTFIPKSAPLPDKVKKSKSKKVFSMKGLHFFMTHASDIYTVYSIDIGAKLFVSAKSKTDTINYLTTKIHLLPEIIETMKVSGKPITINIRG